MFVDKNRNRNRILNVCLDNNDNDNDVYLYGANSTTQFSNLAEDKGQQCSNWAVKIPRETN